MKVGCRHRSCCSFVVTVEVADVPAVSQITHTPQTSLYVAVAGHTDSSVTSTYVPTSQRQVQRKDDHSKQGKQRQQPKQPAVDYNSASTQSTTNGNLDQLTYVGMITGDILQVPADAVVCPCSATLDHERRGLAAVIGEAAGPDLIKECRDIRRQRGPLPFGHVIETTSGRMAKRIPHVVHVVGKKFDSREDYNELQNDLVVVFRNCLSYANDMMINSLSCPAIGAGNCCVTTRNYQIS